MNFIKQLLITALVCFLLQNFLPWWTMALGAAVIAFWLGNKSLVSFGAGFLAIALLWLGMAFFIDSTTGSILSSKVNRLLPLNSFLLTAIIGGLVGGLSALTGALMKSGVR